MLDTIRYMGSLVRSMFSPPRVAGAKRTRPWMLAAVAVMLFGGTGWLSAERANADRLEVAERLNARIDTLSGVFDLVEERYEQDIAPIERVLRQYRDDEALARRIAVSLVREGRANDIEPRLLLAVLLVENPWLNPSASSFMGAQGLMQVMPFHAGEWGCGDDLVAIESNICHGAKIFASYLKSEKGDLERALLRYNGCVRGTNTPNCHTYPQHVFARAGRASILAWQPGRAAAP